MGATFNAFAGVIMGVILDRFGPKVTIRLGTFLFALGCTLFGCSALIDGNSVINFLMFKDSMPTFPLTSCLERVPPQCTLL